MTTARFMPLKVPRSTDECRPNVADGRKPRRSGLEPALELGSRLRCPAMVRAFVFLIGVGISLIACADDRVAAARSKRTAELQELFAKAQVAYPPKQILVRVFKQDAVLELWAGAADGPLTRVMSFPICATSGALGPKRAFGDLQVPEGFYE